MASRTEDAFTDASRRTYMHPSAFGRGVPVPTIASLPLTSGLSAQSRPIDWNPSLYLKFEDERMLAARDLLARVPLASARVVYDLGCGPGNSAELLARRFPDAEITGLDTSEAMLAH